MSHDVDDPGIEARLRRYRPAGPPPDLRARSVITPRVERIWPWAAAAAVLLVSMVSLRGAARVETVALERRLGAASVETAIDDLSKVLGDTADARELATAMVLDDVLRDQDEMTTIAEANGGRP